MSSGSQKRTLRPIRLSKWHLYDMIAKKEVITGDIVVCAEDDELELLLLSKTTMSRVYEYVYGKKYMKMMDQGRLLVDAIVSKDGAIGRGIGNLHNDYDYYGKTREIRQQKGYNRKNKSRLQVGGEGVYVA